MRTTVPHPSVQAVAGALAGAMLASDRWDRPSLLTACADALGARRRWLGPVVDTVLSVFLRPPVDDPRVLTAVLAASPELGEAHRRALRSHRPIRLRHVPVPEPAVRPSARVPALATAPELAALLGVQVGELQWFADTGRWNRRAEQRLTHYRPVWRERPARAPRLLEAPKPRLRALQRTVLDEVLAALPVHPVAHGFVPGRSAVTGAARHVGAAVVIRLDLTSFFAAVTAPQVYGTLRRAGWPAGTAHLITGLCTVPTAITVLAGMPVGGDPDERHALRSALTLAHLPQGAPTSPALANLALVRLDRRLTGLAASIGATYTRYADDLTFSGDGAVARRATALIRTITAIAAEEGHTVNARKTRVEPASVRQRVTGIVVNQRTNVLRAEYDRVRAVLHNCARTGPAAQCDDVAAFREQLLGRIGWIGSCNPARGAALRRSFAAVDWSSGPDHDLSGRSMGT